MSTVLLVGSEEHLFIFCTVVVELSGKPQALHITNIRSVNALSFIPQRASESCIFCAAALIGAEIEGKEMNASFDVMDSCQMLVLK